MSCSQNEQISSIPAIGQRLEPKLSAKGAPLIFVDMPEVLKGPTYSGGMKASYRDTLSGQFRLMYYHQNKTGKTLYYCIAFSNTSNKSINIDWGRIGIGENTDAAVLGRDMTRDWYNTSNTYNRWGTVPANKTKYFTIRTVKNTFTGSAMIDFKVSASITITIIITDTLPYNDIQNGVNSLPILNATILPWIEKINVGKDEEVVGITRGTWEHNTLTGSINYVGKNGNQHITLGNDPRQGAATAWLTGEKIKGYSAVDHKYTTDYGNYGVEYQMSVSVQEPWTGYSYFGTIYFDLIHGNYEWYYSYFVGQVNSGTRISPKWINSNTRGWVLDKRRAGTYSLSTMVSAGSDHPLGLLFVSDN
mgnify:CR=1 FL=1